jgi:hypothetical protein
MSVIWPPPDDPDYALGLAARLSEQMAAIHRFLETFPGEFKLRRDTTEYKAEMIPDHGPAPAPVGWGPTPGEAIDSMLRMASQQ